MNAPQRARLAAAILRGELTIAEVARVAGISRAAVSKWIPPDTARQARRQWAATHATGLIEGTPAKLQQAGPQREKQMRIVSQTNQRRAKAIADLKAGRKTVEQAAQYAGVPISGLVGWAKLAKISLPDKYTQPRRQQGQNKPRILS